MKRIIWKSALLLVLALTAVSQSGTWAGTVISTSDGFTISERLALLRDVVKVTEFDQPGDLFTENYEVWFKQKIDPSDPNSPTFNQKVLISHVSFDAPVFVELQGYTIWSSAAGELAKLYQGNQITIEHRFFDESRPEKNIPWEFLTVANAAYDQHIIIETLKRALYPRNKFISTGISKGGQTTMIHRSIYPDDVDASVCYVAPLNFEREDPRIYEFLKSVGTEEQRQQIQDFQMMCLKRKEELMPIFKEMAKQKKWKWEVKTEMAFELYVLEYSFAFWQWGDVKFNQIPGEKAKAKAVLDHLLKVAGVSFFEIKGVDNNRPFFWAALTEMGIYGYEHEPFKEYLSQQSTYLFDFTFPKGENQEFDPAPMKRVNDFIQANAETMIFIYGELDTWSATAVELSSEATSRGLKKYVLEGGHHGTRIRHFSKREQDDIIETLSEWIGIEAPEMD
ncbi:MAG: S28 family serine protease [Crocinitomicaceae bacterium]|nr:S28 family serine protease [Crocinitomicaceae bacterium]